jgi:hypothetical protein
MRSPGATVVSCAVPESRRHSAATWGIASIQITFDRYGHLMPGNEEEAAGLLDTYLELNVGRESAVSNVG